MSDSFADLWNSSAPSKPPPQPQKLGSILPTSTQPRRPQQDVFSLLSSKGSSGPNSRSITPTVSGTSSRRATPNPVTKSSSNNGDAFGDLLGGSLANSGAGTARMTMAERAAEAERLKLQRLKEHQQSVKTSASSTWAGIDILGQPNPQSFPSSFTKTAPIVSGALEDDWGLDDLISKPAATASMAKPSAATVNDDWLGDFPPNSTELLSNPHAHSSSSVTPIDHGDSSPPLQAQKRTDSPGDFDFGNREDALLDGDNSNDEDDILGALAKPVDALPRSKAPLKSQSSLHNTSSSASPSETSRQRSNGKHLSRPVSPPPHILGQIVEMGFSVQQARVALAATDTGLDVQAALETLLSNGAASGVSADDSPTTPDYHVPPRSATRLMPKDHDRDTPPPPNPKSRGDQRDHGIPEIPDKLLSQASEIGLSMFNKASSFWKEGKERVQKAYVEHTAAVSGTSTPVGGRPKWMTEAIHDEGDGEGDSWKDGLREAARFPDESESTGQRAKSKSQRQQRVPEPEPKPSPRTADLFSNELGPAAYVSPFRRGKTAASAAATASSSTPIQRSTTPLQRASARAPSPLRKRKLVCASAPAIALANRHKDMGSAKFKLGQYADAESAYTLGIGALPSGHLLLVPLHNNRALARLKTGDHAGVIADAGVVVEIVGAGYHPAREAKAETEEDGAGVELGDALVKALKRRAEAWEGKEKWEEAGRDWGVLAGLDWAGAKTRGDAARGVGRCRRMVTQNNRGDNTDAPTSRPKPKLPAKPASLSRVPPSQALKNLRAANNAAEAEDQQRHELKDNVDAKLMAWKGGKETNIRALLGSLDNVLWPELGLQKVGMAELVSPSQVKVKYTRTIAKLHPDKLNASNTTVEQRMLANGVFGALNEAWNAFKQ